MTHRLTTNYAKNYCNWTLIVKVFVENVVTCFFGTRCRLGDLLCYNCMLYLSYHFVCMHVYFVFSLFSRLFFCRFFFSTLILLVGSFDL